MHRENKRPVNINTKTKRLFHFSLSLLSDRISLAHVNMYTCASTGSHDVFPRCVPTMCSHHACRLCVGRAGGSERGSVLRSMRGYLTPPHPLPPPPLLPTQKGEVPPFSRGGGGGGGGDHLRLLTIPNYPAASLQDTLLCGTRATKLRIFCKMFPQQVTQRSRKQVDLDTRKLRSIIMCCVRWPPISLLGIG